MLRASNQSSAIRRRSPRHGKQAATVTKKEEEEQDNMNVVKKGLKNKEDDHESSESESEDENKYEFDGKIYETYQDMVNAKRKRNEEYLKQNGLWKPMSRLAPEIQTPSSNGIKKRKVAASAKKPTEPRRKSSRIAGTPADGKFIEDERGGSFTIADGSTTTRTQRGTSTMTTVDMVRNYGRANDDGSPLSLEEAILLCDPKWVQETTAEAAKTFHKSVLVPAGREDGSSKTKLPNNATSSAGKGRKSKSPTSVVSASAQDTSSLEAKIQNLSVDDPDYVAKVTPDRIYSVATHPSNSHLVVCAGDKQGYCGFWNLGNLNDTSATTTSDNSNDGVHLFRFHTRPINALEWVSPQGLISSSYDGTVRYFDVHKESFEQIFATNEDTDDFYTQYLTMDHRSNQQSFFLSTSAGTVMHIDRRVGSGSSSRHGGSGSNVTFHAQLSDKKINSVR